MGRPLLHYRRDLLHLDATEGVPGPRYRHLWVEAEDINGQRLRVVTYVADGNELDGNPSLRYITLVREGARAHGLPEHYVRFLESREACRVIGVPLALRQDSPGSFIYIGNTGLQSEKAAEHRILHRACLPSLRVGDGSAT